MPDPTSTPTWPTPSLRDPTSDPDYWVAQNRGAGPPGPSPAPSPQYDPNTEALATDLEELYAELRRVNKAQSDAETAVQEYTEEAASYVGADNKVRPGQQAAYAAATSKASRAKRDAAASSADATALQTSIRSTETAYRAARAKTFTTSATKAATSATSGRRQYLSDAIAMGKLDVDKAKEEWDRAKDIATLWKDAVTSAYSAAERIGPKYVTAEDVEDLWEAMKGFEKYGASPHGKAPKPVPLDTIIRPYMESIKDYIPPKVEDWNRLMQVPSGLGTPPMSEGEYVAAAATPAATTPGKLPAAPLPTRSISGGYTPSIPTSKSSAETKGTLVEEEEPSLGRGFRLSPEDEEEVARQFDQSLSPEQRRLIEQLLPGERNPDDDNEVEYRE